MTAGGGGDVGGYEGLGPPPAPPEKLPFIVYGLTIMAVLGGFLFGYDTGVVSGAMIIIKVVMKLDDFQQELVVSVTVGAATVFSLVGGWMNDKWGRKKAIIISSGTFVVGAIILAAAPNFAILIIGRVVVGCAIGISSACVPTYIAETCPSHIRGTMITCFQLLITFGLLMSYLGDAAFANLPDNISWRLMLGVAGVPALFQFFGFFFMPESPRWLASQDRIEEAEAVLKRVSGSDEVAEYELKAIIANRDQTRKELAALGDKSVTVNMFGDPAIRRSLIVGCSLMLFQQLCGINTVMYYSATIIQMGGIHDKQLAIWMASIVAAFNFLCTFIGIYLVERAGRRKLLLGSILGVILCLVFLGGGFYGIAMDSPMSTYTEAGGANFSKNPCQPLKGCDSCSYNPECGFCWTNTAGGPSNGTCLPAVSTVDNGAEFGRCLADNVLPAGPVFNASSTRWAAGWCPSTVSFLPILGMALYLCCFSAGFGPMPWTINAEIYPNWARATGTSIATAMNWLGNLIISLTFLTLARAIKRQGAFFLYAAITAGGFVLFYFIVPETKGKSMENIQALFEKPWFGSSSKSSVKPVSVRYDVPEKVDVGVQYEAVEKKHRSRKSRSPNKDANNVANNTDNATEAS